jgi:kinetochore protein Mis12/MTW1
MSAPTDTTTELMTEHLQYAPLTLIDDVINSANAILYQAMDAFETYLRDTLIPSIPSSTASKSKVFDLDAPEDSERETLYKELEFGMAQVETLLENAVDRNFDAFELYVLRNVFNVPDDVDGFLRLGHHQVDQFMPTDDRDWILRRRRNRTRRLIRHFC